MEASIKRRFSGGVKIQTRFGDVEFLIVELSDVAPPAEGHEIGERKKNGGWKPEQIVVCFRRYIQSRLILEARQRDSHNETTI
jgi:hypothetical protein